MKQRKAAPRRVSCCDAHCAGKRGDWIWTKPHIWPEVQNRLNRRKQNRSATGATAATAATAA